MNASCSTGHHHETPSARSEHASSRKAEAEANREAGAGGQQNGVTVVVACYMVEIGSNTINMLIRLRWLAEVAATDRRKVEAALTAMIADSSKDFS